MSLVRQLLLMLVAVGLVGLTVELALLEHYEEWQQVLPLAALGAGAIALGALVLRPARVTVRAFQAVMVSFVVLGGAGIYLHYSGNVEFEIEMAPDARGLALVWSALRGATPALAPGALAQLGLLGLIASVRHPAGRASRAATN